MANSIAEEIRLIQEWRIREKFLDESPELKFFLTIN
jgi:hypothetical protein